MKEVLKTIKAYPHQAMVLLIVLCIFGLSLFVLNIYFGEKSELEKNISPVSVSFDGCLATADISLKVVCWTTFLENKMHSEGLKKTFEAFTLIYKADPDFVAYGCHGAVHSIGEIAYDVYSRGEQIEFSKDASACGYGFYHGFLGKLLHERPDMNEAVAFCESLRSSVNDEIAYKTCFHGIGHGMIEEEPLAEYYWGNFEALLDPALKTCSFLPEAFQQRECADGVFNGLNAFMSNDKYGFTYDKVEPFKWCDRFKDNRIHFVSCHFETAQSFSQQNMISNVEEVLPFIEALDSELQTTVVDIAIGNLMQSDIIKEDNSNYFKECSIFDPSSLEYTCLNAIVGGFFAYGEPGNESQKAQVFCDSSVATQKQKVWCQEIYKSYAQYVQ